MKILRYLKYLLLVVLVLYLGFIWGNSIKSAVESNEISLGVVKFIREFLNIQDVSRFNHYVRKLAHFSEFAGLAIILSLCFRAFGFKFRFFLVYVLFFGLCTAVADEFLQLYSAGRGSSVKDIIIDFGGVIFGVFIFKTLSLYLKDFASIFEH